MLWAVQSHIINSQAEVTPESPDALNYLLQSDHNLDQFIDAARELQLVNKDPSRREATIETLHYRFDVLWSSFSIFSMQFPTDMAPDSYVQEFVSSTQKFLADSESLMARDAELTDESLSQLVLGAQEISREIRTLGQGYFVNYTKITDASKHQLEKLKGYMRLFIALLLITSSLGVGLLIRSNYKINALLVEATAARSQLAVTVDELRSGRRERRAKDTFIAAASHDLRQPLHALGLFLNSLKLEVKPSGEHTLGEAVHCIEALNRLFNSMLDLSRLDAGVVTVEQENFDLQKLLAALRGELLANAQNHALNISINGPEAFAYTDSVLLARIIRNIVDNAIMHSEASELLIDYHAVKNEYEIVISDNGRGIPIDEQTEVFSEYYQLGNPERDRSKGLGLGLSIVRRLSDLLDIQLSLKSKIGEGTKFTMRVPMGQAIAEPIDQRLRINAPRPIDDETVIVVIDDDESIRTAMQIMLTNLNLQAICGESIDDALNQLADAGLEPDLIIADYRLREHQTGDAVIRSLREVVDRDVPGLIITGDTSPQRVSEVTATGFEILHKPVDGDVLYRKIVSMLRQGEPV